MAAACLLPKHAEHLLTGDGQVKHNRLLYRAKHILRLGYKRNMLSESLDVRMVYLLLHSAFFGKHNMFICSLLLKSSMPTEDSK